MKLQRWNVYAETDESDNLLGVVKTSETAPKKTAMAKAFSKFAPDGYTIGFKLAVRKTGIETV